jgi:hypothetical protein
LRSKSLLLYFGLLSSALLGQLFFLRSAQSCGLFLGNSLPGTTTL